MSLTFNPNQPAKTKQYLWATYIPDRHPAFKLHHQSNHAKSAFQYRGNGILYKWDSINEEWKEIFRVENSEYQTCEHGGSPKENYRTKKIYHQYYKWIGKDESSRKIAVCIDCCRQKNIHVEWGDGE